jgi:hypothetical protein
MVWSHWHHDKCLIIGCGKPRQVHNVVMKLVEDRQNANVVGWVNNQAFALRITHEWKHACMMSKRTFIKREAISYWCKWSTK